MINFLLLSIPLIAGFGPIASFFTLGSVNIFAFRLLSVLLFILTLTGFLGRQRFQAPHIFYLCILFLWLFWGGLGFFWSDDQLSFISAYFQLFLGVASATTMMLIIVNVGNVTFLKKGWMLAALVFCSFGVVELLTDWHFPSAWYDMQPEYTKPFIVMVTFGNPNNFASFLILSISLILASSGPISSSRKLLLLGFILMLFLTGSRLGIIGVVLLFMLRGSVPKLPYAVALVIIFLVLDSMAALIGYQELDDLLSLLNTDQATCSSVAIRLFMFKVGLEGLRDSGGLGVGAGNFSTIAENNPMLASSCGITDPHFWLLQVAVEYGLFFVLFYLSSFFVAFLCSRHRDSLANVSNLNWGLLAVAFFFASITNSSFTGVPINWLFYGLLLALSCEAQEEKQQNFAHSDRLEN